MPSSCARSLGHLRGLRVALAFAFGGKAGQRGGIGAIALLAGQQAGGHVDTCTDCDCQSLHNRVRHAQLSQIITQVLDEAGVDPEFGF